MTIIGMYLASWLFKVVSLTYLAGIIAGLLAFFMPPFISISSRVLLICISAGCIGGGTAYWVAFHQGETFAIQKMAAREAATVQRVEQKTREVDQCNGGADWDVTTGTCAAR